MGLRLGVLALLLLAAPLTAQDAGSRFRAANDQARSGDHPRAIAGYAEIAAGGQESASLYWNWAQVASARGAAGEALWALLRAREVEPGDRALEREIDRARQAANLDAAEVQPEPLSALARFARRFHLDALALMLALLSLGAHLVVRARPTSRRAETVAWVACGLTILAAAAPIAGIFASPTAVVVRRGAPLLDAASPTAAVTGSLREGEVVLMLGASGGYLRIEDSSGARGWVLGSDAWRLDRRPLPPSPVSAAPPTPTPPQAGGTPSSTGGNP